ncbi:MAG: aminotransferase class IV, partial [Alphaproteobacteria bacterium]|nr:aminotransferase class IV [Alphaproteobacteria bacterium]
AGAGTAIMLDMQGYVAEGYGNNVFAVDHGTLLTPPLGNILAGVTRQTVMDLCRREGIPVAERPMTVYDLVTADEVFESATMAEIVPVVAIDGRAVGDGRPGAMTRRVHALLRALMEGGSESTPIFNA